MFCYKNDKKGADRFRKGILLALCCILPVSLMGCSLLFPKKETKENSVTEQTKIVSEKKWNVHQLDEFTFYTNPDWDRHNEMAFQTKDGNQVFGITGISPLGANGSKEFFQTTYEFLKAEGKLKIEKVSESFEERTNSQGISYQVGWMEGHMGASPNITAFVMVPQKNLAISFFAQLRDDSIPAEEVKAEIEKMFQDIEFHYGGKDYVSGNTFIVGEKSELVLYPDKTFKYYLSMDDHENNYYEGTYEVAYGDAAVDMVLSSKGHSVTKGVLERLLSLQQERGAHLMNNSSFVSWKRARESEGQKVEPNLSGEYVYKVNRDTFHAIILHNKKLVTSRIIEEDIDVRTLYLGQYIKDLNGFDLRHAVSGNGHYWGFRNVTR